MEVRLGALSLAKALLHKSGDRRTSPFPGRTYLMASVTGMRAALAALHPAPAPSEEVNPPGSYPDIYGWGSDAEYIERLGFAACPLCGVHLSNGVLQDGDEKGDGSGKLIRLHTKFECMGCGKGFGGATERKTRKPATGTGTKIEKVRDKQNGVTRPSGGGKCRAVWDGLDGLAAATRPLHRCGSLQRRRAGTRPLRWCSSTSGASSTESAGGDAARPRP